MYLRSHAQKYIPGVYLHVCKLYTRVNLAHSNWTLVGMQEQLLSSNNLKTLYELSNLTDELCRVPIIFKVLISTR